jgi:hypothetical protein
MKNDDWKRALGLQTKPQKYKQKTKTDNDKTATKVGLWLKIFIGVGGFLTFLLIWGMTIDKVCVKGNPDYEKGTGFCVGNGRKDIELREKEERIAAIKRQKEEAIAAQAEKVRRHADEIAEKQKGEEGTFRAIRYICEQTIKSRLREPQSYEKISSSFYGSPAGGNKKGVIIEYRAKNGFGGMNVASAGCLTETGKVEDLKLTGSTE